MSSLPFSITAKVECSELIMFIAERNGERLAVQRYNIGSQTGRRDFSERLVNDPALQDGAVFTVEDVESELGRVEIRALAQLEANREALRADAEDQTDTADEAEEEKKRDPATSELLVQLALTRYRIGVDDHDNAFAVRRNGPNIALMFRGSKDMLRASLSKQFREVYKRTPSASALADALTNLQGVALDAKPEPTYLRVARPAEGVVIDLGTSDGRAVLVDPGGWRIVDKSPVLFRRTALTAALPTPERGGDLGLLAELLNVADEGWPVIVGWLVASFIPNIPHPILMLGGEAGSGKSTFARLLIGLFDPSSAPLRSQPDDVERWVIAANGSWGVAIDNVSTIPAWWSDSLCKCVTDDGWIRRKLWTDGELAVISFRRVVILTSIDAGALRGDLGDRVLLCDLERIADHQRRAETELNRLFETNRPLILGAIFDLLARVLAILPTIELPTGPRMYDFAQVLAAVDTVLDTHALATYVGQRDRIAADVVDADPVGRAIAQLIDLHGTWTGTTGELLVAIAPDPDSRKWPRDWPKTPRGLTGRLARVAPALRALGIEIERPQRKPGGKRDRIVMIRRVGGYTVPIVPTVPNGSRDATDGSSGGTAEDEASARSYGDRPVDNGSEGVATAFKDDRDGWDDPAGVLSDDDLEAREPAGIRDVESEAEEDSWGS